MWDRIFHSKKLSCFLYFFDLVWGDIWCYNLKGPISSALFIRLWGIRDPLTTTDNLLGITIKTVF